MQLLCMSSFLSFIDSSWKTLNLQLKEIRGFRALAYVFLEYTYRVMDVKVDQPHLDGLSGGSCVIPRGLLMPRWRHLGASSSSSLCRWLSVYREFGMTDWEESWVIHSIWFSFLQPSF